MTWLRPRAGRLCSATALVPAPDPLVPLENDGRPANNERGRGRQAATLSPCRRRSDHPSRGLGAPSAPGSVKIVASARVSRFPRRSDVARTFGERSLLGDSYIQRGGWCCTADRPILGANPSRFRLEPTPLRDLVAHLVPKRQATSTGCMFSDGSRTPGPSAAYGAGAPPLSLIGGALLLSRRRKGAALRLRRSTSIGDAFATRVTDVILGRWEPSARRGGSAVVARLRLSIYRPPALFVPKGEKEGGLLFCLKHGWPGGAYRDRTGDLRLAKPALSQLS